MDIKADVIALLDSYGVINANESDVLLDFAISRAEEMILTDIHHDEMPEGLKNTFIAMAAGFYLADKKAAGMLDVESVDFGATPAKQIKEGDVQITFATASDGSLTPEARFDALVNRLIHPDPFVFTRFRRLSW